MSRKYPEYDAQVGRWYRWFTPTCKEYEPDVISCGKPENVEPKKEEQRGFCPFRNHHTRCSYRCLLHDGNGCMIAAVPADRETKGKSCPFSSFICGGNCALYNDGCTIIHYLEKGL